MPSTLAENKHLAYGLRQRELNQRLAALPGEGRLAVLVGVVDALRGAEQCQVTPQQLGAEISGAAARVLWRQSVDTASVRHSTAFHEAGHAVAAAHLAVPFQSASIDPAQDQRSLGRVSFDREQVSPSLSRERSEALAIMAAAGVAAERLAGHEVFDASADLKAAHEHVLTLGYDEASALAYLKFLEHRAAALVRAQWAWVERVADALLVRETLSFDDVVALHPPSPVTPNTDGAV